MESTHAHRHTLTQALFFLSFYTKSLVLIIMLCAIYRASACPIVLACWVGPNSPECSGRVKRNTDAVCWKAGLLWTQERLPGWPRCLHCKAINPGVWIRSHIIVDGESPPWPHNSWGGLKLCCHGTGAICCFLLCCLETQREFKDNHFI